MPVFADAALAARLDGLCASEMIRFAKTALALDPACGATWLEVGGGAAAFVASDSPVNQGVGLGFEGPVDAEQIAQLESFFAEKGAQPLLQVCPLAHPTLLACLSARGWVVDGFENVLFREFAPADVDAPHDPAAPASGSDRANAIEIRAITTEEDRDLWTLVAATGFSAPLTPLPEQIALGHVVVHRPGSRLFLAFIDGKAAGTGELYVEDGVAWLSADSTLPQFRGRGVQRALQRHRLTLGARAGCDIAASEAAPGSGSQRNMERAGFRVAYTRADFILPTPGRA